jgi:hypothetical protein
MPEKTPENLQELLYNFTILYERWGEDKLAFMKHAVTMEQSAKELVTKINEFSNIKEETKKDIINTINSAARNVSDEVGKKTQELIRKDIEQNIQELEKTVNKGKEVVNYFYTASKSSAFKDRILTLVASALLGLVVASATLFVFIPKFTFSKADLVTYNNGKYLEKFWGKLSPVEQKKLNDIALSKSVSNVKKSKHRENTTGSNSDADLDQSF